MRGMTEVEFDHLTENEEWAALLQTGVFRIEFFKADNAKRRIMIVSLDQSLFPVFQNTSGQKKPGAPGQIKCWSFKDNYWRSFIIEHVASVHKVNDPERLLRDIRHDRSVKENLAPKPKKKVTKK